jgi:hypothetical protein
VVVVPRLRVVAVVVEPAVVAEVVVVSGVDHH